jgi:hypothetical protein
MSRFDFTLNNGGKVIAVRDTATNRMIMENGRLLGPAGVEQTRHDDASWTLPAGAGGGHRQDAADRPGMIRSAREARRMMMRRDVDPRWTEPEPVRLSDALTRFDGVDRRKTVPLPGTITSASQAREIMQRRMFR